MAWWLSWPFDCEFKFHQVKIHSLTSHHTCITSRCNERPGLTLTGDGHLELFSPQSCAYMYFSAIAQMMSTFLLWRNRELAAQMYGACFKGTQPCCQMSLYLPGNQWWESGYTRLEIMAYRNMSSTNLLWTMLLIYYKVQLHISFIAECVCELQDQITLLENLSTTAWICLLDHICMTNKWKLDYLSNPATLRIMQILTIQNTIFSENYQGQ